MMNWPGMGEMNGKLYPGCMMPGVESKKDIVTINVMMPPILPMAEIFGEKGLQQIRTPNAISIMPNTFENPSTPNKP